MDVFESFDIALPRHSGWQAQAGSFTVDVARHEADADKLQALDRRRQERRRAAGLSRATSCCYLGKNDAGVPMALHALGEYVQPCAGGKGETVLDVQRTVVSDLALGAGSSRRSLLERIATLVVLGKAPAPALAARAQRASAAARATAGRARRVQGQRERAHLRLAGAAGRGRALRLIATSDRARSRRPRSGSTTARARWSASSRTA